MDLKEAVDSTFFTDSMFKSLGTTRTEEKKSRKSQRYIAETEEVDRELPVTDSMKNFLSKKLSDLVADRICFSDEASNAKDDLEINPNGGIKLLKNFPEVKDSDTAIDKNIPEPPKKRKLKEKKKELPEEEKIRQSCISPEEILNESGTIGWAKKPRGITYEYCKKNNKLYLQEPLNEFSQMRKKNNWDESKIAKYKKSR